MNIFVAGIHGVGKTYLANRLPKGSGLLQTSASKLIREERSLPDWNSNKRVSDVDENQVALAAAVARYNVDGTALLLDGHFVLLSQDGGFVPLGPDVFKPLNFSAVVLIEADPDEVAIRVSSRDGLQRETSWLEAFMAKERAQAEAVCRELHLPLRILVSPSDGDFVKAVAL
jgi:adenylate kinase